LRTPGSATNARERLVLRLPRQEEQHGAEQQRSGPSRPAEFGPIAALDRGGDLALGDLAERGEREHQYEHRQHPRDEIATPVANAPGAAAGEPRRQRPPCSRSGPRARVERAPSGRRHRSISGTTTSKLPITATTSARKMPRITWWKMPAAENEPVRHAHAVGDLGAVADDVVAHLAARRFGAAVHFALRRPHQQLLDVGLEAADRIGRLAVGRRRQQRERRAAQPHRLLHLEQAHDEAVVAVADPAAPPANAWPTGTRTCSRS
jgi:hypothetical protein